MGNSAKLKRVIGRQPTVKFESVLEILLAHDLQQLGCEVPFASPEPNVSLAGTAA